MSLTEFAIALTLTLGQPSPQPYVGTWIAEFEGRTFVKVELTTTEGRLSGAIGLGNIQLDAAGEVKMAESVPTRLSPIFDVVVRDSVVSFIHKDDHDTDHFEIRRVGDGAELRFLPSDEDRRELAAAGVPMLKPIRLKRVK
jgi:hypothetical protein